MTGADLAARVAAAHWYHTIELPGGVVTPGAFDTRPTVDRVPLPGSLAGQRCLDVGTWDGFWAFEMERRGATEVVAIDLEDPARWDWPYHQAPGGPEMVAHVKAADSAFAVARDALGSGVERRDLSVYDLDPAEHGTFDFVFLGSLLLHLRDPVRALEAVRSVCAGDAVIADTVEAIPSLLHPRTPTARLDALAKPWWWLPNRAGLHRMVTVAGFEILERTGLYYLPLGAGHARASGPELLRGLRTAEGREQAITQLRGIPHAAVRARPS